MPKSTDRRRSQVQRSRLGISS